MLLKKEIIDDNKKLKQENTLLKALEQGQKEEIKRLQNIIVRLESELYHDWLEYKDSDCENIFSKAIEDKAIYDYIQELKGSDKE